MKKAKEQSLTEQTIMKALEWSYDKAINGGIPGTETAIELAMNYQKKGGTPEEQAKRLVNWQMSKSATSGFVTGLGGIITLPVAVPTNIVSVLFIQTRMAAAIAYIGGYDVKDDEVKTFVYACLAGNEAKDILKNVGIQFGKKLAVSTIKRIPVTVITKINQKVGFRLLTKFGEKGVINLGKAVPLLGGVIGGTTDAAGTKIIGKVAINLFIGKDGSATASNNRNSKDANPVIIDME